MVPRVRITPMQIGVLISIAVLACIDLGCTSTSLTNMWKDPSYQNAPMTNMLVISVNKDPLRRRLWEDALVAELSTHNVVVTPSYRLFPNALPDTQQTIATIREKKFDAVLVVKRLPTEISTHYVKGYSTAEPRIKYDRWTKTYYTVYRNVETEGYSDTDRVVRHEVNVWATKDLWTTQEGGRMIWTGTGETLDPTSREAVRSEVVDAIVPELVRQGIILEK
jgi:hypothetical protein